MRRGSLPLAATAPATVKECGPDKPLDICPGRLVRNTPKSGDLPRAITCSGRGVRLPGSGKSVRWRQVFCIAGPWPVERVVMPEDRGVSIVREDSVARQAGVPAAPRAVRLGDVDCRRSISRDPSLVGCEPHPAGMIIRLHPPPYLATDFPDRLRQLHDAFVRFFRLRSIGKADIILGIGGDMEVTLDQALPPRALTRLERRLAKQVFRPLSGGEAAKFLGVDKKDLRRLRDEGAISPCGLVSANRYGRSYSYPVFAVDDLVQVRNALEPSNGRGEAQE